MKAYLSVTRLQPENAEAFGKLGFVYGKLRHYGEAAQALKCAIELKPDYATAYFNLGLVYSYLNQRESATREARLLRSIDDQLAHKLFDDIHADKVVRVRTSAP